MKCSTIIQNARKQKRKLLTLAESQTILQRHKIPFVKNILVKYEEDAINAAKKIGFPVALKVVSPDITHKTEFGAVQLNLRNEAEVLLAFRKIVHSIKKRRRDVRISGFLVQQMVGGAEVLVGGKKDLQFGQTLAFGAGGVFVEVYDDVSFRVVPITKKDAREMIEEVKAYKILHGYRGRHYDLAALEKILLHTSELLEKHQDIVELDINPIFVGAKGAVAVDARIAIS
ncbi:MAG TPA: acetate--CoA ligase family protein [archaeon]|nr:acetate--CoA ligase family protein [archaeon]